MNMDELKHILERMEKRQIEIQEENRLIMKKLRIKRREDSPKNENGESKELSRLSMVNILSYMDPGKRLHLSYCYPKIRPIEKSVPVVLSKLQIYDSEIIINEILFPVHSYTSSVFASAAEFEDELKCVDVAFSKICFDIFAGRKQFEVGTFINNYFFPFEIDMNVGRAIVESRIGIFAKHYSNITGIIKHVLFIGRNRAGDLRLPWVQNAELLESIFGNWGFFVNDLRNILAKRICIHCTTNDNIYQRLIIGWCENKTRAVGSELILTISPSVENNVLHNIFTGYPHYLLEFYRLGDGSLRLPMDNNSEFVLRRNNERHLFTPIYLKNTNFQNYVHLKVQHLQL